MNLNVNDDIQIENATSENLQEYIPNVGIDEFAVLAKSEDNYIQFYRNEDGTCSLEYRDGSFEKHFAAASTSLSLDDVLNAMLSYLAEDQAKWQETHSWSKVDFDEDFDGGYLDDENS